MIDFINSFAWYENVFIVLCVLIMLSMWDLKK